MELTHWKKLTNPIYLGAYSFNPKEEKILIIESINSEYVIGHDGQKSLCTVARFNKEKPMILNATNCKIITKIYKTPFIEDWVGKQIQVYVDPNVKAKGEITEGLRVRPRISKTKNEDIVCSECNNIIKPAVGKTAEWVAEYTKKQYGKELCNICATKLKEQMELVTNNENENTIEIEIESDIK